MSFVTSILAVLVLIGDVVGASEPPLHLPERPHAMIAVGALDVAFNTIQTTVHIRTFITPNHQTSNAQEPLPLGTRTMQG